MLTHASLFSGIDGFDMAATVKGWYNIFSCEKAPFCRKILKFYWPQTEQYEDIYQFDATTYRGTINVLSGGFPCQPFSTAGRRMGKADDRYLWPETLRIITEIRPEWIVLENVAGLFTILELESLSEMEVKAIELFCSDSEQEANATIIRLQRRIIGIIITEIRSAGYLSPQLEDGTPIVLCVPACAVNAPHRRDRTWFVAYRDRFGNEGRPDRSGTAQNAAFWQDLSLNPERPGPIRFTADPMASDSNTRKKSEKWNGNDLASTAQAIAGQTGPLNPRFVAEMMGFPANWTELPFLNGEKPV